jgi:metal transporter CNNM
MIHIATCLTHCHSLLPGALQLKTKVAFDVYTPIRKVYALSSATVLNKRTMVSIYANGYSRIPIFEERPSQGDTPDRTGMVGVLMTRQLIVVDWDHERELHTLSLGKVPCVSPRIDLVSLTNIFQTGGSHIAFVCAQPNIANRALDNDLAIPVEAGCMGIVTLEGKSNRGWLKDEMYQSKIVF